MLISTRLGHLGNVLRPEIKNMISKGVSSIRSPVCNLKQFGATITHEAFTSAVVKEFRREYQIKTKCCVVDDLSGTKDIEYIRKGMLELSTWDWAFGQTPEFLYTLERKFSWGDVTAEIRSKHGLILDCSLRLTNTGITNTGITSAAFELISQWARSFHEGKRYGFLHEAGDAQDTDSRSGGLHLLRCVRNQPILDVKEWLEDATKVQSRGLQLVPYRPCI